MLIVSMRALFVWEWICWIWNITHFKLKFQITFFSPVMHLLSRWTIFFLYSNTCIISIKHIPSFPSASWQLHSPYVSDLLIQQSQFHLVSLNRFSEFSQNTCCYEAPEAKTCQFSISDLPCILLSKVAEVQLSHMKMWQK